MRSGEVVSGRYLVTVAGADGSDVQPCPPEHWPEPQLWAAQAARPGTRAGLGPGLGPSPAVGPLALGAGPGDLPLLDREAEVAQLLGMLAEGRSIRLVGEPGSGRSALLSAVAEGAGELAPHGVVRLSGHRREADDLLQDLFAATHRAPGFRPDHAQLPDLLATVGAIVVIDEVLPDGAELERLLAAAPECAFLLTVAPGSGGVLPAGSRLEDHLVGGLSRPACLALTARLAGRPLDEAERAWAVDLWFESEGLPLRFVQAAALLRRRDTAVDALLAAEEDHHEVFGRPEGDEQPSDPAIREAELRGSVPLPSVAQTAAPAVHLVEGLGEGARAVLRLAVALGGECPTAPHLPALIDVDHGESALRELVDCGLAESIGGHHRLTAGVLEALAPQWEHDASSTLGAAQHFSWWVGHGSVTTGQIAAEAEVVLGALQADRDAGRTDAVLSLARSAAPALALALRWGAWREVLELGLAVARETGDGREEAWFQHELGVYWFCLDARERARAAVEAAGALRTALGEVRALAVTRRLLTLLQEVERPRAVTEAPTQVIRRPVIRALAERSWRTAAHPGRGVKGAIGHLGTVRGWSRRSVLLAVCGLFALGAVGTAVGIGVSGGAGDSGGQPGGTGTSGAVLPGAPTTGATGSASASASATASGSASDPASDQASASPSASDTATGTASASASPTRPRGTASATTARPSATGTTPGTPSQPAPTTPGQPAPTTTPPVVPPTPTWRPSQPPSPSPSPSSASPTSPTSSPTDTTSPSGSASASGPSGPAAPSSH
ncbi:hypothetical protein GCM10009665_63490 [Kitasatospora nipponensis]|uniref:ATP-binding protein n=1 Tax=Kitasatospora nipponensis TaxID=258049 RepID=A0ABP4HLA4_9ACTN